jgi:adenylate cyclase class IV
MMAIQYEIERRAALNIDDLERVKKFLKNSKLLSKDNFVTYHFNKPVHLRVRYSKGKDYAVVTHKEILKGSTNRVEVQFKVMLSELKAFVRVLRNLGFKKCVKVESRYESYRKGKFNFQLANGPYYGTILEIESLGKKGKNVEKEIRTVFETLNLKMIPEKKYNGMKKKMLNDAKPIEKFKELIG